MKYARFRSRRIELACLILLLPMCIAADLRAQADAELLFSGVPAASSPLEGLRPEVRKGAGLSGAVQIIFVDAADVIAPATLSPFGSGWGDGHRWTPLHRSEEGPRVLGVPTGPPGYITGEIRAPGEVGTWLLENVHGSALTIITRMPASMQSGDRLNGYHIGFYPTAGSNRTDAYAPPSAFIEVTPHNQDLRISEHLEIRQFLTKDQIDVWPKYFALDLRLIDKLELVIQELNAMGVKAEKMHVMSGFRTPQYNGPGGDGRAALSRHMWGDAADVWIDNDGDGVMDDLNGDGRVDIDDAAVMMRAVERIDRRFPELIGGAGTYPTTDTHGPYIHIDVRGHIARW